ncbi:hypothetical protein RHGRI_016111 [Rhododendron griersonianum]|uniref:Uncharacterized protein n=1 Tax=Rhododendron griersonianum TaxID=479676 RepID=A0AAV6JSP5_9ERIC|nr:hypothetical protein RHGRI_016111 [Rhododendron griersonianum]
MQFDHYTPKTSCYLTILSFKNITHNPLHTTTKNHLPNFPSFPRHSPPSPIQTPPFFHPYTAAITHHQAPPTSSQICLSSSPLFPPTLSIEPSIASSPSIDKQEIVDPSIQHDLESEDHTMEVEKQVTDVVVTEQKPQQEGDTSTLGSYVGPSAIPTSTRPPYDCTEHFTTETFFHPMKRWQIG